MRSRILASTLALALMAPTATAVAASAAQPARAHAMVIRAPGRRCPGPYLGPGHNYRCIYIHLKGHRLSHKVGRCLIAVGIGTFGTVIGGIIGGGAARAIAGAVVGGGASACLNAILGARDVRAVGLTT